MAVVQRTQAAAERARRTRVLRRWRAAGTAARAAFRLASHGTVANPAGVAPGPPRWGCLWRHQWAQRYFLYTWQHAYSVSDSESDSE